MNWLTWYKRIILLVGYIQLIKDNQYSIVQGGRLCKCNYEYATKIVCIQVCYGYIVANRVKEFLASLDLWLEESGSEIILDPHYYLITRQNDM